MAMDQPTHCSGCSAYDLVELEKGQWALVCEDHPEDRVIFNDRARMLEWMAIMMDHQKGPWHMHVKREDHMTEVFCGIEHDRVEELGTPAPTGS